MTAIALVGTKRTLRVVERNVRSYARMWPAFLTGFLEPIFYLFSIGIGVGELVGDLPGPGGHPVSYELFVAPAMLATSAMNGTVFDTTFNFFFKYKYAKTFDGMLATPLGVADIARGELAWALLRGTIYVAGFLLTMIALDLVESWWALLALPAAALIGFAFAGAGLGLTTYMRSFTDFAYVGLAITPLFLFSATFFPLSEYPGALAWFVRISPLYQGVAIERALVLGDVSWSLIGHAAYLAAMGVFGLRLATRRLGFLLQP
ncbi:MAG TPA: ABC transporter permease [Acidimicrobiales bacterium]|nr:ABC transporter permease [Acidimicrobiales bacterium]